MTAGDRILARGRSGGDTGSFAATSIIVPFNRRPEWPLLF
jgi:hypothetical protein